jgi:GR25 family glycosyltransferase involved in LPS biosynthesis
MIDKLYYINLDKRPDRKDHFLNECTKAGIPSNIIQRFSGFDGDTYPFDKEDLELFKHANYIGEEYEKKVIGNQLSHYSILKEMVKNQYDSILICQDDVVFKADFITHFKKLMKDIPDDAEIVNIGFYEHLMYGESIPWNFKSTNDFNELGESKVNDSICRLNYYINPGSLAYVVTLKGAIYLLHHFRKHGFLKETDHNYNDYLLDKNIFYGSTTVLCTCEPTLGSDIFADCQDCTKTTTKTTTVRTGTTIITTTIIITTTHLGSTKDIKID